MRPKASADPDQFSAFHAATPTVAEPSEASHLLRAMAAVLARQHPATTAEALRMLRRGYPDIPLAMRVAAMCAGGK